MSEKKLSELKECERKQIDWKSVNKEWYMVSEDIERGAMICLRIIHTHSSTRSLIYTQPHTYMGAVN